MSLGLLEKAARVPAYKPDLPSSSRSPTPGPPSPSCRSTCHSRRSTARSSRPAATSAIPSCALLPHHAAAPMPGTIAASLLVFIRRWATTSRPRWWAHQRHHDRQYRAVAVRQGRQLADGAAVSIVAMAVITVLVCLFLWGVGRRPTSRAEGVVHRGAPARFDLIGLYAIGYLVLPLWPGAAAALFSFNDSIYVAFSAQGLHAAVVRADGRERPAPGGVGEQPQGRPVGFRHQHHPRHLRRQGGDALPLPYRAPVMA